MVRLSGRFLLASLVCAGLAACATPPGDEAPNLTRTIGEATYALQAYLEGGSANQRLLTLQGSALAGQPIDRAAFEGSFPAASVRARVAVLVLLNAYVTKLAALADNDASLEDLESARTLDPQIADLSRRFGTLRDPTAAGYAAPVAALVGWVGESYTGAQRSQAVADALHNAAPAANQLLDVLAADLKTIQDQRLSGSAGLLEQERAYYNANLRRLSLSDRESLVAAMEDGIVAHQRAESPVPAALVEALRKMHTALLTYVSSPRSSADQQTVGAAMQAFAETVAPLATTLVGH